MFEVLVNINWDIIFLVELDFFLTDFSNLFTSTTNTICIPAINTEHIDCDMITTQDITFVMIDEPDGSIKGRHKLVGNCISMNWNTRVRTKLVQKENTCIEVTW